MTLPKPLKVTVLALVSLVAVFILVVIGIGVWASRQPAAPLPPAELIGGQKDEHGCLGPAGYSWCESKQKCLRVWEEPCAEATNK